MNNKQSARGCPICAEQDVEVLRRQNFMLPDDHPLVDGYDVVCCRQCGFVFADTAVTQSAYDQFYSRQSKYEDQHTATGGGDTPWDAERLQETAIGLSRHLPSKTARIVDIGCANGGLLCALRQLGYTNIYGVDPSPICVRNAQARDLDVCTGSLFELPQGLKPFDCVILSHVLEHIQDLRPAIRRLPGILRSRGVLYVEVPDASRYAELLTTPFQDFNTEHINHFSPLGLRNLLETSGWRVQTIQQKLIISAPDMSYPAVFAVASRSSPVPLDPDLQLRRLVEDYIRRSQMMLDGIDQRIRRALPSGCGIIVWGTGELAMKLLAETSLREACVVAYVDGNPVNHGRKFGGVAIQSPVQIAGRSEPILITTIIHQQEVLRDIRDKYHITNPVVTLVDSAIAS